MIKNCFFETYSWKFDKSTEREVTFKGITQKIMSKTECIGCSLHTKSYKFETHKECDQATCPIWQAYLNSI